MSDLKAPFPYFGGKRKAADLVWTALGDVGGYIEPFAGSAAVLLARPDVPGRRVETINDMDGWLINAWRAIKNAPEDVAGHAVGPVSEIDYHARLAWLQERRSPDLVAWLEGDPEAYDAKAAAWWLYVAACGIGDPWDAGPWRVVDGHLTNTASSRTSATRDGESTGVNRKLPHLGNAGRGIHRELPHLCNAGRGIHRELPHLGNAGRGHLDRLTTYMRALADRLTHVRITCGDWTRVLKPSVTRATAGNPTVGIFLDPPYSTSGDLYAHTSADVDTQVREWCLTAPPEYRIVLAGFTGDHDELLDHGWDIIDGKSGGGAGYNTDPKAGRRERLWLSPSCLTSSHTLDLWGGGAA